MADLPPDLSLLPDPALGVFETLLVAGGQPVELEAHLDRLRASLDRLYEAPLPTEAGALVAASADGLVLGRLRLSASAAGRGEVALDVTTAAIDPTILFPPFEGGLELRACPAASWNGAHKWADRRLLEGLEATAAPATPLLVGGDGAVLETTRANVFVVRADGTLVTPPADGRVLPGVARMRALEAARAAGIEPVETVVTLGELAAAREAFATGSVRGVEPIRSIDGTSLPHADASVTGAIATALRERWLGDS